MKSKRLLHGLLACLAPLSLTILLVQCDIISDGDSGSSGSLVGQPHTLTGTTSYVISGGSLVFTHGGVWYDCDSTTLMTHVYQNTDISHYLLQGDTFRFYSDDSATLGADLLYLNRLFTNYKRVEGGTGLQGLWEYTGSSYVDLLGIQTAQEKKRQDSSDAVTHQRWAYYRTQQIHITADKFDYYTEYQSARYALDDWNGHLYGGSSEPRGQRYNISIALVDAHTVKMTGKTTGEVVTWAQYGDEYESYASNLAGHDSIVHDLPSKIPDCHEGTAISASSWVSRFYSGNKKSSSTAKIAVLPL